MFNKPRRFLFAYGKVFRNVFHVKRNRELEGLFYCFAGCLYHLICNENDARTE